MKLIGLKIFLFFFVILDVVAFPTSCVQNPTVFCYFYLDEDTATPGLDSNNPYLVLSKKNGEMITQDEVANPSKEGFAFLGWSEQTIETNPVEFDVIVSGHYWCGERNVMVFIALWEEVIPEDPK
ncbi:MAG: hypothetical protein KKE16_07025 [Firmicutes bacterium]|nr:hypothetical protein [Bacillota bacterium]